MNSAFTAEDVVGLTERLATEEDPAGDWLLDWLETHVPRQRDAFALLYMFATTEARWLREMTPTGENETVLATIEPKGTLDETSPGIAIARMITTAVNGDTDMLTAIIHTALDVPESEASKLVAQALITYRNLTLGYLQFRREQGDL